MKGIVTDQERYVFSSDTRKRNLTMKHFLLLLSSVFALNLSGQVLKGTVTYQEVYTFNFDELVEEGEIEAFELEQIKAFMPEKEVLKKRLFFTADHSLCMYAPPEEQPESKLLQGMPGEDFDEMGGMGFSDWLDGQCYTNLQTKEVVTAQNGFGKKFVITEDAEPTQWKITGKQKPILGHPCMQAVASDSTGMIVWFAPSIPVSTGPDGIKGLPGLVLEVQHAEENYVITAIEIQSDTVDETQITRPTDGKKMTRSKYEKMMQAKFQEMEEMYHEGMEDDY